MTEVATPGNYRRLRWLGIKLNTESIRETLTLLADAQTIASLDEDMRNELPALDNMTENGKPIEYGKRTKQTKRRTPDSEARRQQRIVFGDDDRDTADMEAQYWEGEHRQTEEPPNNMIDHD